MSAHTREPRLYERQRRRIEEFLRAGFSIDDAAATVSRGYSLGAPIATGLRDVASTTPWRSQYSVPPDQRPAPRHVPRWVDDLARAIDRQPRHLRELVPLGLRELSIEHRLVVWLHAQQGLSFRQIERGQAYLLGISRSGAQRSWERSLDHLVEYVYSDDDQIRWERSADEHCPTG